ncbi:TPA: ribonuclease HI family protein [Candidatus Bathyarchaeota archaeon]|nr:ribonuclease HI family protein [Candidatus Bathyarchaeota archaeon]HIJ08905.1 ribonuclease HI family protein [Candidatus Bathyarchaeota archaeon]
MRLKVFSDGGARGNPGPSAIAFLVVSEDERVLHTDRLFLGDHTNNQAEYWAIITALQYAASLKAEEVTCYLDSELVTKQLNGEYAVKNPELQKLWEKTRELRLRIKKVTFTNVPRTNRYIQQADSLLNQVLDEEIKRRRLKT